MLCTNCHANEATYHYKNISNGVVREEHLCPLCAAKLKGVAGVGGLTDLLSGFFMPSAAPKKRVCPTCGTTEAEVSRTGQVGCPECYKVFSGLLDPYIRRVHGAEIHVGKRPGGTVDLKTGEKERLRKELDEAVAVQNYEQAAVLRDQLRALEGGEQA